MKRKLFTIVGLAGLLVAFTTLSAVAEQKKTSKKPKVIVFGVNGAELDIIRPLVVRGEMPNFARLVENGVSGKLRTVSAPNCPKAYTAIQTSTPPESNGVTGFIV